MAKDLSGAQVGTAPSNNINSPRPDTYRGLNVFPQTYKFLTTDRYGDINLFYWAKAERGDIQQLQSVHDLHTFTLQSPMVSDVEMTKSFFKVPMQAIYPVNWEKIFTIPTQGDDVPGDIRALFNPVMYWNYIKSQSAGQPLGILVVLFSLLEDVFSFGGLLARFNFHLNWKFSGSFASEDYTFVNESIDKIADVFWAYIARVGEINPIIHNGLKVVVKHSITENNPNVYQVSARRFIEILRSGDFTYEDDSVWAVVAEDESVSKFFDLIKTEGYEPARESDYINIEPIIAYQLACSQFFTNDSVDFIYSAELYRQNMKAFVLAANNGRMPTFDYNGVSTEYDVFSFPTQVFLYTSLDSFISYYKNIFSYNRSLRYGDYFTGAKPRPLAVGEYSASVVNSSVSAIDVTRSIQMQRLLNRVNMVGRKLGDYLSGIFGGRLPEAPKDVPVFLAHQTFAISGFDTNNTSEIQFNPLFQNTITSHLRSSDSRHSFEIEIDEPCYLIGVNTYQIMRIYSKTLDRFAFHHDRYDDFIPEMQYIGDQDIKLDELDSSLNRHSIPFGYALRYMEYKQRYSYASGGFIENLPSWAFITDNTDGTPAQFNITPDYIRSSPSEFDRFYKSLTGYSLASYFHFIVVHTNVTAPSRMMEYAPEILK